MMVASSNYWVNYSNSFTVRSATIGLVCKFVTNYILDIEQLNLSKMLPNTADMSLECSIVFSHPKYDVKPNQANLKVYRFLFD